MEKRERGSNIIYHIILRLLGRISSKEEGSGNKSFGEENQDLKNTGMGKSIKLYGTLYTPEGQSPLLPRPPRHHPRRCRSPPRSRSPSRPTGSGRSEQDIYSAINIQGDQLNIAVFFWYLWKKTCPISSVHVYYSIHWTSKFLQGTRKTGHVELVTLFINRYINYHDMCYLLNMNNCFLYWLN